MVEVSDVFLDKESEMLHFCGVIVEEGSLAGQGAEAFQSATGDSQVVADECCHARELARSCAS